MHTATVTKEVYRITKGRNFKILHRSFNKSENRCINPNLFPDLSLCGQSMSAIRNAYCVLGLPEAILSMINQLVCLVYKMSEKFSISSSNDLFF